MSKHRPQLHTCNVTEIILTPPSNAKLRDTAIVDLEKCRVLVLLLQERR